MPTFVDEVVAASQIPEFFSFLDRGLEHLLGVGVATLLRRRDAVPHELLPALVPVLKKGIHPQKQKSETQESAENY